VEAPWAFRLQLFAMLLEEAVPTLVARARRGGGNGGCGEAADVSAVVARAAERVGALWRSDMEMASRATEEARSAAQGDAEPAAARFARRFRAHALMELAAWLRVMRGRCEAGVEALVQEALGALEGLKAEAAAAPAVLRLIKLDLDA